MASIAATVLVTEVTLTVCFRCLGWQRTLELVTSFLICCVLSVVLFVAVCLIRRWSRNRFRFSIRALLVGFVLASGLFAGVAEFYVRPYLDRYGSVALQRAGAEVLTARDIESGHYARRNATGLAARTDREITYVSFSDDKMVAAGIAHLRRMPNLRTLCLCGGVSDRGLQRIAGLRSQHDVTLDLMGTNVSDEGLTILRRCPWVTAVWLNGPPISDKGIGILTELANVRRLGLLQEEPGSQMRVTNETVRTIATMKQLLHLTIMAPNVTDECVPELAALSSLRTLRLLRTKITDSGMASLEDALPVCKISRH